MCGFGRIPLGREMGEACVFLKRQKELEEASRKSGHLANAPSIFSPRIFAPVKSPPPDCPPGSASSGGGEGKWAWKSECT